MTKKWLKNGCFLILMALLMATPVFRSMASVFDSQSVVDLMNKERISRKIAPLTINEKLSQAAKDKAHDMILQNYFAHVSPVGVTPWNWIEENKYDYSFAGENLAINFTSAEAQHEALMKSESHKKNILNGKYEEVGVAVVSGIMNGKQTIVTVQEFGTKANGVPTGKEVAGIAIAKDSLADKDAKPLYSLSGNEFNVRGVEKLLATTSEKISPVPAIAFLYVLAMIISLGFFSYEMMQAHLHFALHMTSIHRKKHKKVWDEEFENNDCLLPQNMNDKTVLGKSYLDHMKLRN